MDNVELEYAVLIRKAHEKGDNEGAQELMRAREEYRRYYKP